MQGIPQNVIVRKYQDSDVDGMKAIWNEVVAAGDAFPQDAPLGDDAASFFASQTHCGVALIQDSAESNQIAGLYILHPNNTGRCGHIANASYAVKGSCRGRHIGEMLVKDCLAEAAKAGYRVLQFNAVVAANIHARHLYERLGFMQLGTIKGGFRLGDGDDAKYVDICPYYISLVQLQSNKA